MQSINTGGNKKKEKELAVLIYFCMFDLDQ
jgi:hypothetical protein